MLPSARGKIGLPLIKKPPVQFHLGHASGVKGDEWKYSAGEAWTGEMGYIPSRQ